MAGRVKRTSFWWGMGHRNDTQKISGSDERKGDSTSPLEAQKVRAVGTYRRERRRSAWNRIVFMALRYHG
jgi:hypothetical protein